MPSLLRSVRTRVLVATGVVALVIVNRLPTSGGVRAPPTTRPSCPTSTPRSPMPATRALPPRSSAADTSRRSRPSGSADSSGRPVTPDTPFVIGSLSKSLTALAILRLVDAGAIELDAPVTRYLPAFRTVSPDPTPITVRHALTQTSGLPGSAIDLSSPRSTIAEQVASLATVQPLSAPGIRYAYANANYVVLGAVIEAVTGRSYPAAMQELVFGPLGMAHTTADPDVARDLGLGDAHRLWFGIPLAAKPLFRPDLAPAGFIASTAADLARPIEMILAGGSIDGRSFLSRSRCRGPHDRRPDHGRR